MHDSLIRQVRALKPTYPSITVIVPTSRAMPEKAKNADHVREACRRACYELKQHNIDAPTCAKLCAELETLATGIDYTRSLDGVMLLVNPQVSRAHILARPCQASVFIGSYFALGHILQCMGDDSSYGIVVVNHEKARLLICRDHHCTETITPLKSPQGESLQGFPLTAVPPSEHKIEALREGDIDAQYRTARVRVFAKLVADELMKALKDTQLPCVIVAHKDVQEFLTQALHGHVRIIGSLAENYMWEPVHKIHDQVDVLVKSLQADRVKQLLSEFRESINRDRQSSGLQTTWEAIQDGRARIVFIEEGFDARGRIDPANARHIEVFDNPREGVVLDGIADLLIAQTWAHDGDVVLVPNGSLKDAGRVGAILRY